MEFSDRPRPRWAPPSIRALVHHRRARPLGTLLCALAALWVLQAEHRNAAEARASWGTTHDAWVALADLPAGHQLTSDDVELRRLPQIAMPEGAASSPTGQRLHEAVAAGEILRSAQLRAGSASAAGATLAEGIGAVLLPGPAPHLTAGDRVDLYDSFTAQRLSAGAEVVAVVDTQVLVAVDADDLPVVVQVLAAADVVAVLVG